VFLEAFLPAVTYCNIGRNCRVGCHC
jgi:hypothetical protein